MIRSFLIGLMLLMLSACGLPFPLNIPSSEPAEPSPYSPASFHHCLVSRTSENSQLFIQCESESIYLDDSTCLQHALVYLTQPLPTVDCSAGELYQGNRNVVSEVPLTQNLVRGFLADDTI